jgi:phosphoribosyl 1,2-cyclic phosphate phosphodiesterase
VAALKVTLLGTGTSHGVPVIACTCPVCRSTDPRNRRGRTSAWLRAGKASLLIDTPPDHREQALRHRISRVDAVLVTHAHADHVGGLDDLRAYCQKQKAALPVYANASTLRGLRRRFSYVFTAGDEGGGKPRLKLRHAAAPFKAAGVKVVPVPLRHGSLGVTGWRVGRFAYLTDTNGIPEKSFALLRGLDVLVIDGLRPRPHSTHFCFDEAIMAARRIGARRSFLTHITHLSYHARTEKTFPPGIRLAYDGLTLNIRG